MADLIERLVDEPRQFGYFQALSLLEEFFAAQGIPDPIRTGRVRLQADPGLAFPPSDIASIVDDKGIIRFFLSFMGLIGVSSPLPTYFSEHIARNEEQTNALRDFLVIFNHRMYALFYQAWKKYRLLRAVVTNSTDGLGMRLGALAGLTGPIDTPQKVRVLAYCGLLAGRSRGGAGLSTLLSDFFGALPVTIQSWQPRWTPMNDIPPLGVNSCLGVNSVAGTTKLDFAGKFRVMIGPVGRETYEKFLQGSENVSIIKSLVDGYCTDPLDYDIEVKLQSVELIPVVLGEDAAPLGVTTSLGRSSATSGVQSVIVN